ncbi:MAG: hypothetical protein AB1546_11365 [bacterium]
MKNTRWIAAAIMSLIISFGFTASPARGSEVGPVKISTSSGVESHSNISDAEGNFSGETYIVNVVSFNRQLQKNVIGSVYYYNRHSMDG